MRIVRYHWRRRKLLMVLFVAAVTAIAMMSAWSLLSSLREVNVTVDAHGRIADRVSYAGVSIVDDPSQLVNASAFGLLIVILAASTAHRDRRFLVSCSVPRYRIFLGTSLFLILSSAALTLLAVFAVPALCRAALLMLGIPLRGGWSASTLLAGGDGQILKSALSACMDMVGSAGWSMLLAYLLLRWWKPILILCAAGIAAIILMVQMVRWETFVLQWLQGLEGWVRWAMDQLIPWIREFYARDNQFVRSAYGCGAGLAAMLLSYPIMRGMKVT